MTKEQTLEAFGNLVTEHKVRVAAKAKELMAEIKSAEDLYAAAGYPAPMAQLFNVADQLSKQLDPTIGA